MIQAGGEEGMWSFDRYARWIEQRTDWVRSAAPPAAEERPGVPRIEDAMDLAELSELVDKLEKRGQ